ncbi:MAG: ribose 5-phosphate isomerase B [Anaerolineales bacterium]|nr:ribose 5-phosphate isomerase B [Anaerolineales bacterium]
MRVAIGTDHAGYPIKDAVVSVVRESGHDVIDHGIDSEESADYPDIVEKIGRDIQSGNADLGIALCGSGVGACIAANKMMGVYAAICHDTYSAKQGVNHDNMNVLCLGGRIVGTELAKELVRSFLEARFIGDDEGEERHRRRVNKVIKLEEEGKQ